METTDREDCTPMAWYPAITHLAREGRMTVTIGRRGGNVAARGADRMRRIGALTAFAKDDPETEERLAALW